MMPTQMTSREVLHRNIDTMPDSQIPLAIEFFDSLKAKDRKPSTKLLRTVEDIEAGRNLVGPFRNMEDFKASLLSDDDA